MASSYFNARIAQRGIGSPWDDQIRTAAASLGLEPALIKAVISAESEWNPVAVSFNNSSYGLMQINVAAHAISVAQANDPNWAIPYAAGILLRQIQLRPNLEVALAAYNAGTSRANADLQARILGNVNGVGTYVTTVLQYLEWFLANDSAMPTLSVLNAGGFVPDPATVDPVPADGGAGATGFPAGSVLGGAAPGRAGRPDPAGPGHDAP